MTAVEEAAGPQMIGVAEAAKLLGIGTKLAYRLIREDAFPVPVLQITPHCWRVSKPMVMRVVETGAPVRAGAA